MKITIDSYIFELVYNYFQNVLEKLRKLRKSCNYKGNINRIYIDRLHYNCFQQLPKDLRK